MIDAQTMMSEVRQAGFRPELDERGMVHFKVEGWKYFVSRFDSTSIVIGTRASWVLRRPSDEKTAHLLAERFDPEAWIRVRRMDGGMLDIVVVNQQEIRSEDHFRSIFLTELETTRRILREFVQGMHDAPGPVVTA